MPRKASFDRETALDRAMALFWAKGFHATSLKDIEAALDMRPGSIYAAFGSKEELFERALERYTQTSRSVLSAAMVGAEGPLEGLAAHIRGLGAAMSAPRDTAMPSRACMLMKTVLEMPAEDAALRQVAEAMMRATEGVFAEAFRSAQAVGDLPAEADPDHLAARLQAQILGLRAYAQRSDAGERIKALAEDIAKDVEALAS